MKTLPTNVSQTIHYWAADAVCRSPQNRCFRAWVKDGNLCYRLTEPFPWWPKSKIQRFVLRGNQRPCLSELQKFEAERSHLGRLTLFGISFFAELVTDYYESHGYQMTMDFRGNLLSCSHDPESRAPSCKRIELAFTRMEVPK